MHLQKLRNSFQVGVVFLLCVSCPCKHIFKYRFCKFHIALVDYSQSWVPGTNFKSSGFIEAEKLISSGQDNLKIATTPLWLASKHIFFKFQNANLNDIQIQIASANFKSLALTEAKKLKGNLNQFVLILGPKLGGSGPLILNKSWSITLPGFFLSFKHCLQAKKTNLITLRQRKAQQLK